MTISVEQNASVSAKLFEVTDESVDESWKECLSTAHPHCQFCTLDWYRSWLTTIGTRPPWTGRGCVLTATAPTGRTIGILPLVIAEKFGVKIISIAGYFQPHRTGVWSRGDEDDAAKATADFLFDGGDNWHAARFGPLELSIAGNRALIERIKLRSWRAQLSKMGTTIVLSQLPSSFHEFQTQILGLKFAKQIQYYERKAVRDNGLKIEQAHNPRGEALEQFLRDCQRIESQSWIAQVPQGFLRFATELDLDFWRRVSARGLGSDAYVSFWVMYLKEQPASYCVTLTAGGVRYTIANQYDETFAKSRTGSILYSHMVKDACERGVQSIDFGPGLLHYKSRWGGVPVGNRVMLTAFPARASGRFLGIAHQALTGCTMLARTLRRRRAVQSPIASKED